jgi:hypothetical protein
MTRKKERLGLTRSNSDHMITLAVGRSRMRGNALLAPISRLLAYWTRVYSESVGKRGAAA